MLNNQRIAGPETLLSICNSPTRNTYRRTAMPSVISMGGHAPLKAAALALILVAGLEAQPKLPPEAATGFEVVTVKRTSPKMRVIWMCINPGGRMIVDNFTLKMLVQAAYSVQSLQIAGGPKWVDDETYSIVAVPPHESALSKIRTRNCKEIPPQEEMQMLQILLRDRFNLRMHEETKSAPVQNLLLAGNHPKLSAPADRNTHAVVVYGFSSGAEHVDYFRGENATMGQFAERISEILEEPVIDKTGLYDHFDFQVSFIKDPANSTSGPSLSTAVRELGLKLEPSKGPVRYLIIDHAERPADN